MIKDVLVYTKQTLDEHLKNCFHLEENVTVLNHLVDQNGTAPPKNQNKMVISLVNLEQETNRPFMNRTPSFGENGYEEINPSARFNMDLLCTSCFDDYEEALKFLTETISFFQGSNCFNRKNNPDLPQGVKKLTFEIESFNYSETHNLWTAMGAKYQPSIIYKARLVSIQSHVTKEVGSLAENIATLVQPN